MSLDRPQLFQQCSVWLSSKTSTKRLSRREGAGRGWYTSSPYIHHLFKFICTNNPHLRKNHHTLETRGKQGAIRQPYHPSQCHLLNRSWLYLYAWLPLQYTSPPSPPKTACRSGERRTQCKFATRGAWTTEGAFSPVGHKTTTIPENIFGMATSLSRDRHTSSAAPNGVRAAARNSSCVVDFEHLHISEIVDNGPAVISTSGSARCILSHQ